MRNRAIDRDVIEAAAGTHAEVGHVIEHAGRPGSAGKLDVQEIGATYVAEPEGGTRIGSHAGELDIVELDIAHVTHIDMLCRQWTEPCRLGIVIRSFGRLQRGHFGRAAAPVQEGTVAYLDIFQGIAPDAPDGRAHRALTP